MNTNNIKPRKTMIKKTIIGLSGLMGIILLAIVFFDPYIARFGVWSIVQWEKAAAKRGNINAMYRLACRYDCPAIGDIWQGDHSEAVKWYRKAAELGDARAQYQLGRICAEGYDVPLDENEALKWFQKSADQGNSDAQYELGYWYFIGRRVEKSESEAVAWWQKSAEQGNMFAQNRLADCYLNGTGVTEDKAEAFRWYQKAAEQGDSDSQYMLAWCYFNGVGTEKNDEEAVKWWLKCSLYDPWAKYYLGVCYENGFGVDKKLTEAVKWYRKAAVQGNLDAQYAFGNCLYNGLGTMENKEKALEWIQKAAEQGNTEAQEMLNDAGKQDPYDSIEEEKNLSIVRRFPLPLKKTADERSLRTPQSLWSSAPATEEQIKKALSFLPDVVAEVNGTKITKQQIVDLLLSKKLSQQVLALTPESYLRNVMQQYVDQKIDTEILRQKAVAAGFVPSEEFVKTYFDYSIKKLSAEQFDEVKAQLKERGLSLEAYRDEIAKEADIQRNASIAAYEEKKFVAEAEKKVTDAGVIKFYNENRQMYYVPENITVAHILIQCEPVSELDSAEEKERKIKAELLAKEQIYNIYADLVKDPAVFDKLAQEKSNCPSGKHDNGKLPAFDKEGMLLDQSGMLDPDFTAAAFKIKKVGEFTKPIHTQFGYHIVKLLKTAPEGYLPLDEVRQKVFGDFVDRTVAEEIQAMIKAERAKGGVKVYYPTSIASVHATNLK